MHVLENDGKEPAAAIEVYESVRGAAQIYFEDFFNSSSSGFVFCRDVACYVSTFVYAWHA